MEGIVPVSYTHLDVYKRQFLYFVLYRIAGYRTAVVRSNLEHSFPEKSASEIKEIEKAYYHHLCDVVVETFKSFSIGEKEILKRMVVENPELPDQYFHEGRSAVSYTHLVQLPIIMINRA